MPAPKGNQNAVGHENPRTGKRGYALSVSLPYEEYRAFRDACELQEGRTLNNGEFDDLLRDAFHQGVRAVINAPKPDQKWSVCLFHGGKLLREVKDLPEEEALRFAVGHQNVEVDGSICNYIVAWQQGSRTNERRWKAGEKPEHLKF